MRDIYLSETPAEQALAQWQEALHEQGWPRREAEEIDVPAAIGRVTAEAVQARMSSPHYHAAAMDGIAVFSGDTFGASESTPLTLSREKAFPVNTGNPVPHGCDAVIMIEEVREVPGGYEIIHGASPWQHVRPIGEDVVVTEMILPSRHEIRPEDVGALLAGGVTRIKVLKQPRVVFIPSGNEVVDLFALGGQPPQPGQVIEYNSHVLRGLAAEWGAVGSARKAVPDDPALIKENLEASLQEGDVVVTIAGSSAGTRDYTASTMGEMGRVVIHGVATKPGKPVILAVIKGKPVLGIPGYPVSAYLAANLFLKPLLAEYMGVPPVPAPRIRASFARRFTSPMGVDEFVRVRMGKVGGKWVASPLSRGAGVISSLVKADGVVWFPRTSQGVDAGAEVEVELRRPLEEIEAAVLLAGSHDPILDILGDILRRGNPPRDLAVSTVGSLGGLLALKRGEAHIATSHLLDEETGEYNFPYIKRYLPDLPVVVVNLVYRQQGFIIPVGNPQQIHDFTDLARPGVRFLNRQKGAGTRILLDLELVRHGISPDQINGYEREEYTHTAVAAAVSAGSADVGLGLYSAAQALGLSFVPVAEERYDLLIPADLAGSPMARDILQVVRSQEFKDLVEARGGYSIRQTGEILKGGE